MDKIHKILKKLMKKNILIGIGMWIITLLLFHQFLTPHFATDTYRIADKGYEQYAIENHLLDGRIISALVLKIAGCLQISIESLSVIQFILAATIAVMTIIILIKEIEKRYPSRNKIEKIVRMLLCYTLIVNPMFLENLYFMESFSMTISLLFYLLAAKALLNRKKYYGLKSGILLIMGIISYQGTIAMYFLMVVFLSMLENKETKEIIKEIGMSIGIGIVGILINQIGIITIERIFSLYQERKIQLDTILTNLVSITMNWKEIVIKTGNLLPPYTYLFFILMIETLIVIKVKKPTTEYNREKVLLEQLALIIISIVLGIGISIINTSGFWSGRIRFGIGAGISCLLLHMITKTDILMRKQKIDIAIIGIGIVYMIVVFGNIPLITKTVKIVNEKDKEQVIEIVQDIKRHEEIVGIKVQNVAVIITKNQVYKSYYPKLLYQGSVIAISAVKAQWSAPGAINYYGNIKLQEKKPSKEELEEYHRKKDHKDYQCIGDTLYVTCYMY